MSVDLRTSVIILESNDKKIPYYSKAIISWSVCAITGEYGIDFLINYAITYIFCLRLKFNTRSRGRVQCTNIRTSFTPPQTSAHV